VCGFFLWFIFNSSIIITNKNNTAMAPTYTNRSINIKNSIFKNNKLKQDPIITKIRLSE